MSNNLLRILDLSLPKGQSLEPDLFVLVGDFNIHIWQDLIHKSKSCQVS